MSAPSSDFPAIAPSEQTRADGCSPARQRRFLTVRTNRLACIAPIDTAPHF